MKLTDLIQPGLVISDLEPIDKFEALRAMAERLASKTAKISAEDLFQRIVEREKLSSTGIGSGIAIPHARLDGIEEHAIVFARSHRGIHYDAIDDRPVHLIFMIVGPTTANETHLKALARISKFLHDTSFREQLLIAQSGEEIHEAIRKKDAQY